MNPSSSVKSASLKAPTFDVPPDILVSIEHPGIVRKVEKAVEMIGGSQAIGQMLEEGTERTLALKFKPDDPTSSTILSHHISTNNILLRVTVPKRTGRKRKRGSSDEFSGDTEDVPHFPSSTAHFLRSLADNPTSYGVEAIGSIKSVHVWRSMPDYVYATQKSHFLNEIKSKILPQQYPLIKQWKMPQTYGLTDTETLPPPVWSIYSIPQNYVYRQNPAVKTAIDPVTGEKSLQNKLPITKIYSYQLQWDADQIPSSAMSECPPLEEQAQSFQDLVQNLRDIFERRPIWTRRAMANQLPENAPFFFIGSALQYVAYALRSGPWRDTYVAFGVDPRTDRKYRFYQTITIQLVPKDMKMEGAREDFKRTWKRGRDPESHIFTGTKKVGPDGKVWQLCDLEDPQLKELVNVPDLYLRATCETRYFGWYSNGTNAKMRVVLKAKVDASISGDELNDTALSNLLKLPDAWTDATRIDDQDKPSDPTTATLGAKPSKQEMEWAAAYRGLCRTEAGKVPASGASGKGRLSKAKPELRPSYLDRRQDHQPETRSEDVYSITKDNAQSQDHEEEDQIAAIYGEPDSDDNESDAVNDEMNDDDHNGDEAQNEDGPNRNELIG